ncbi:acyl-CoA dehydrogenase NM domain-like protein [Rhizodiscina lignyota]|uniref:Acyl-CoA dehydrogenase NM domain-like protein n=1 Tax=Rhizodiscina lignyota TaxID=1504668 RepID=A0A9P4IF03_9PEZI|nr:acyl-CoA dehydrogenase NM domain-like protein [Rhizodiscina lignyota]
METIRIPSLIADKISPRARETLAVVKKFVEEDCVPADEVFEAQLSWDPDKRFKNIPLILEDLKAKARKLGLWNLWLSKHYEGGAGFTNLEYGLMCEVLGRSLLSREAMNCSAPDTGNMEVLAMYGTEEQKKQWLQPLLDGKIRSAYVMTERFIASSDAKNIELDMRKEGNEYVLNGVKWWISSAGDPRTKLMIVFCRSDAQNPNPLKRHSIVLVPRDSPGITVKRALTVFGYDDAPQGHCEVIFKNVRVPTSNIVLGEGRGFEVMQGRMGPGRLHHCMRAIGCAERGLEYMIARTHQRSAQGKKLAEQGVIQDWVAKSRIEIDAGRLLVCNAADMIDRGNTKSAMVELAICKIYVPQMACNVLDRAMQAHGGGGLCQDFPLAKTWAYLRTTRLADGPDEAHAAQLARIENKRHKELIDMIQTQEKKVEDLMKEYKVQIRAQL